jgi:hypothetical protein
VPYGPFAIGISEKSLDKEIGIMVLKLLLGLATKLFFIRQQTIGFDSRVTVVELKRRNFVRCLNCVTRWVTARQMVSACSAGVWYVNWRWTIRNSRIGPKSHA